MTHRQTVIDSGAQFYFLSNPTWSPDSTHIAFVI
jgi:hypothetical protein